MSNNRTRSPAPKKGRAPSTTQTKSGQSGPSKKTAAGQRFAERQAAKQQAAQEARHVRNRRYAFVSIAVVVVIVAALVLVKVSGGGGGSSGTTDIASPPGGTPIAPATLSKLASVPMSTLAAAPTNGIINQPQAISGAALTQNGKPELLFVGAEFCPHCGAERWAMYMALSKFGTFAPEPGRIHSATQDGNVPTLTFYGTTYTSPYFVFTPVETYTNKPSGDGYAPLQVPTTEQNQLWQSLGGGSFPFLDFAGKATLVGAQYSFAPLQNLPFSAVAAQVGNNSTTIGANINASAYALIREICGSLSSHQPADVCSAASSG
jgi:hypothetical protein